MERNQRGEHIFQQPGPSPPRHPNKSLLIYDHRPVKSASYTYLANSPLAQYITLAQNSTTRMTTTKAYDNLNGLTSISSANASSVVHRVRDILECGGKRSTTRLSDAPNAENFRHVSPIRKQRPPSVPQSQFMQPHSEQLLKISRSVLRWGDGYHFASILDTCLALKGFSAGIRFKENHAKYDFD